MRRFQRSRREEGAPGRGTLPHAPTWGGIPDRAEGPGGGMFTILLGALTAFGPMSIDMYLPALPALADTLGADAAGISLTLSAFFLGFAAGQLVYGPASDRWGRKPPMLIGIGLYVCASMWCALSTRIAPLIVLRLIQGVGACAGPLLARAVVRDLFARDQAAAMLSLMMLVMGTAPLLAPLLGGRLLLVFGWRSIFWVLSGFGALCFLGAWLGLPETLKEAGRFEAAPLVMAARYGTLLRNRAYVGYVVTSGAASGGLFAYLAGSPFVFIRVYHVSAQDSGFLFALNVIGLMVCAAINSRLVLRYGVDRMLRHGVAALAAAGCALALIAITRPDGLPALLAPLLVFIGCISFIGGNALAGALSVFPSMAGTASALAGTVQFAFGALSGAAVGAFYNGTAVPMGVVIAVMGLVSLLAHRLLVRA